MVFDDLHIAEKWPSLKIIHADQRMEEIAAQSINIMERLINGQKVPRRTLIPRVVEWNI